MHKKKIGFLRLGLLASSAIFFGCAPTETVVSSTEPVPAEVVTQSDEPVADAIESAERVVALTSLSADLTGNLDATKLVGIPGSRLLAQNPLFAEIPTVSEGRTEPDLEKIIELQPDLVIGAKGFHDKALERLSDLDIAVLSVDINSWENLRSFTTTLATALDADATPLMERYDACLAQPADDNPSALVLVSRQPILAPNKNSWAGDFLSQFNIQNLAADLQGESEFDGYVTLSAEKVIEADPDSLMVVDTGEDLLGQLKSESFWNQLSATKEGNVVSFDYFGMVNPGSIDSIEATCAQLKSLGAE